MAVPFAVAISVAIKLQIDRPTDRPVVSDAYSTNSEPSRITQQPLETHCWKCAGMRG